MLRLYRRIPHVSGLAARARGLLLYKRLCEREKSIRLGLLNYLKLEIKVEQGLELQNDHCYSFYLIHTSLYCHT